MKTSVLRRLALLWAVLLCGSLLALPAAAAEVDAPYAESGDMDYIRSYIVTVDPREDGTADITYDIDWQVIDGDATDYLSWVKIGLANSSVDELTPLTDTISDLQYSSDGGSYAKVVFAAATMPPMWPRRMAVRAAYILCSAYIRATCSHEMTTVRQTLTLRQAGSTI